MFIPKEISPLNDAIDRPLKVGDFVTAVWADAQVELFEVLGVEIRSMGRRNGIAKCVKLKRMFNCVGNMSNDEPTFKMSKQVTWVDPQYVLINYMSR